LFLTSFTGGFFVLRKEIYMPAVGAEGPRFYQKPQGPDLGGFGQERGARGRAAGPVTTIDGVRGHGGSGLSVVNRTVETGQTIAAYAERFRGRGGQERIFSHGTTPLLEAVNRVAPTGANGSRTILEVGAGEGLHAALLARNPLSTVIAVEPNAADTGINDLLAAHTFGLQSGVHVVPADMFAVLGGMGRLANGSVDTITVPSDDAMYPMLSSIGTRIEGQQDAIAIRRPGTVYSSSVAHLFDGLGRRNLWEVSANAVPVGGLVAASLKAEGDAQQGRAKEVGRAPEGMYGQDSSHPGITRLFVSDPGVIAQEMRDAGLELVCPPITWATPGYDFPGENAQHVGFLAQKVA
jgi:hypothetical protein